jgi:hypothetical protein
VRKIGLLVALNRINPNRRRGKPPPEMQREILSMKLGFICPNVPGHLNPMTALARQLQARQHDVVFLYSSGATGLPFVRSPDKDHIIDNIRVASKLQGDDSLEFGRPKREGVASIQRDRRN